MPSGDCNSAVAAGNALISCRVLYAVQKIFGTWPSACMAESACVLLAHVLVVAFVHDACKNLAHFFGQRVRNLQGSPRPALKMSQLEEKPLKCLSTPIRSK